MSEAQANLGGFPCIKCGMWHPTEDETGDFPGSASRVRECGRAPAPKLASYLTQENSVLHERVRKLEIALAKEREANAKIADEVAAKCAGDEDAFTKWRSEAAVRAANSIASLIRGRGET